MLLVALLVSLVGLQSLGAPSYTTDMQSLEDTDYVSSEDTESPWIGEEYSEDTNSLYRTKKYKGSTHFVNADTSEEDELDGNGNNFIRLGRSMEVQDDDAPKYERESSDESSMWLDRGKPENFLRFGREKPGNFYRLGRAKSSSDLLRFGGVDKDSFLRLGRDKDSNVVRFGQGKPDSFLRLGRDKDSNVVRFGRGKPDSFLRLGRDKDSNVVRFGRGRPDSFLRLGRDKDSNVVRFGRGRPDSFLRLGRDKDSNVMRLGRGRSDSFLRLGRDKDSNVVRFGWGKPDSFLRLGRDKDSNVVRFGRGKPDNFLRLGRDKDSNVVRFGRGKPDSNIRLGREPNENSSVDPIDEFVELENEPEYILETDSDARSGKWESGFKRLGKASLPVMELPSSGKESLGDDFLPIPSQTNEGLSKDLGMEDFNYKFLRYRRNGNGKSVRFGRGKLADSNFIRLGRSGGDIIDDGLEQVDRTGKDVRKLNILQLGRSIPEEDLIRLGRDTEYVHEPTEAQFTTSHNEKDNVTVDANHVNRRRRSLPSEVPPMIVAYSDIDQKADYKRSLLLDGKTGHPHFTPMSASLSSYILAPELSLLPESAQVDVKRDKSFVRLG